VERMKKTLWAIFWAASLHLANAPVLFAQNHQQNDDSMESVSAPRATPDKTAEDFLDEGDDEEEDPVYA